MYILPPYDDNLQEGELAEWLEEQEEDKAEVSQVTLKARRQV